MYGVNPCVLVGLLMLAFQACAVVNGLPYSNTTPPLELTNEDARLVVRAMNLHRSNVTPEASNMMQLVWNKELETLATNHSQKCNNVANTDRHGAGGFDFVGETRKWIDAGGSSARAAILEMVRAVAQTADAYNYTSNTCSGNCAQYKRLIWARTKAVGCGVTICPSGQQMLRKLVVCDFGPSRMTSGERPYKSGLACSACPLPPACNGSLCVPGQANQYVNSTTFVKGERNTIVAWVNALRGSVTPPAANMQRVNWSEALEQRAAAYGRSCVLPKTVGVTAFLAFANQTIMASVYSSVYAWASQSVLYTFANSSCRGDCQSYFQMVWAHTTAVGCSVSTCRYVKRPGNEKVLPLARFFICVYDPVMNSSYATPYANGTSCSGCPNANCTNNLCGVTHYNCTGNSCKGPGNGAILLDDGFFAAVVMVFALFATAFVVF